MIETLPPSPVCEPPLWLEARSRGTMSSRAVVFHAPSHVFQSPGGGENQLVQTGLHLESRGVDVHLFCPWTDRLDRARLLHLFGMSREGLELARVARARKIPVVLSPICWFEPRAIAALATGPAGRAWGLAKWSALQVSSRWPNWRRDLLRLADAVLPNSLAEARQLVRLFGIDPGRVRIVPNGVRSTFAQASPELIRALHGPDDFVLFVGRIEPRKNVLGLIRAVARVGVPLVVIGAPPAGHEPFAEECRRAGEGFVLWLGALDHDDPLLASAYAAARVFALPSWFETPGLAALEAALAGCAVAITPYGCTREYFGNRVEYARPDRTAEIHAAVLRGWLLGPDLRLADHVAAHFLWSDVARRTADVYEQVAD